MSENTIHEGEAKEHVNAAGTSEAVKPSSPLLVIRQNADSGEKVSSEPLTKVVDLEQYRSGQSQVISEEALVQEWQLNTEDQTPPVKLIMVSSGFGGKRSYMSRQTDIQCKAA
ncbi:hypothetical protein [Paenibacillus sp. 32352]|uniref:hypothetical protein n=1 Tax=Paenibacillus sp. 32352 TaxID=1969111 RepID=UPI0009AD75F3|nr:hypothetical protein [Paenibacillus sp. 32352]